MVNLEEILEKKPYTCPIMVVERIDFSDIIVTSPTGDEEYNNNVIGGGGSTNPLDELEIDDQGAG